MRYETKKLLEVLEYHTTGNIRGLLCNTCNRALGMFKDDINILHNAIIYLQNN